MALLNTDGIGIPISPAFSHMLNASFTMNDIVKESKIMAILEVRSQVVLALNV